MSISTNSPIEQIRLFLEQMNTLGVDTVYLPDSLIKQMKSKKERLDELDQLLKNCTLCKLCKERNKLVFGDGNPDADLVFVGEGPGYDEDRQGLPFVGKAGQLLTKMIQAMKLQRKDVYICNVVKCHPPGNRNPSPDEIVSCEPFLLQQLDIIQPKVIVALGKFAAQSLLQTNETISRLRGVWHDYHGIDLMPTFHPAYLLRNPNDKRKAWEDLQSVMSKLGIPLT